ncbi:type VI secretion system protein TssA [Salmonella enterica]|nr:type VI secretion system protein TssA [Salmonella enterica]
MGMNTGERMMDIRLDCEALLAPLRASDPAGDNVEFTLEYDEIQRCRQSEPDYLSRGEWTTELKKADWPLVRTHCEDLLRHTGKDFQVACWLFEACYQMAGLAGLCEGARFLARFVTHYWESGWPSLAEGEGIRRQNITSNTVAALRDFLLQFPLSGVAESAFSAWKQCRDDDEVPGAVSLPEKEQYEAVAYSAWAQALTVEALTERMDELTQCLDGVTILDQTVGACEGMGGSPFSPVLALLMTLREGLAGIRQTRFPDLPEKQQAEPAGQGDVTRAGRRDEMNRTSAVEQLAALARYFRRTEPSSPVPFLLERAVRLAGMSALDWLEDITRDRNNLDDVYFVLKGARAGDEN